MTANRELVAGDVARGFAAPVIAVWDLAVRICLVLWTWRALRRAPRRIALPHAGAPVRLVRAAIVPAGGYLALAIAFLPRRRRGEVKVALLAGQALCEIDRRAAQEIDPELACDQVRAAVAYLAGEQPEPPRLYEPGAAGQGDADSEVDQATADLRARLAAWLPGLRATIEVLPGDAGRRCRAMIERIGDAVIRDRAALAEGYASAHTAGEAVIYAMRLAAPSVRPPDATCRAVGRVLRTIDELGLIDLGLAASGDAGAAAQDRDVRALHDQRLREALGELSHVPRLARWLPARVGPGTRAAAALVVTTVCAGVLRAQTGAPPRLHPLRAALAAAWSRRAYLAAIDHAIGRATVRLARPTFAEGTLDTKLNVDLDQIQLPPRRTKRAHAAARRTARRRSGVHL